MRTEGRSPSVLKYSEGLVLANIRSSSACILRESSSE